MGKEDTPRWLLHEAAGRIPQFLAYTSMHGTALVSSWHGMASPGAGDPREQDKDHNTFTLPSVTLLCHFCNTLLILQIYPGQCGIELHNSMNTRRDHRVIWEAVYHNVCNSFNTSFLGACWAKDPTASSLRVHIKRGTGSCSSGDDILGAGEGRDHKEVNKVTINSDQWVTGTLGERMSEK